MSATNRLTPDRPSLANAVRIQARVLLALVLRDAKSRHGRTALGYLWALLQPMVMIGIIASIFVLADRRAPLGDHPAVFVMTGYLPYILFTNMTIQMTGAIRSSKALLYFPVITNIDVMVSRAILEIATMTWVMVLLFGALWLAGYNALPFSFLDALAAIGAIALLGVGAGFCNAIVAMLVASWPIVVTWMNRIVFFTCGVFYLPGSMPQAAQDVLKYLPMTHAVDWFRTSFFFGYNSDFASKTFVVAGGVWLVFCGLAMERLFRRRLF